MKIFRQDYYFKKNSGRAKCIAGPTSLKSCRAMARRAIPIAHSMLDGWRWMGSRMEFVYKYEYIWCIRLNDIILKSSQDKEEHSRSIHDLHRLLMVCGLLVVEHPETREDREHHLLLHLDDVLRQRVHQCALLTCRRDRVLGVHLFLLNRQARRTFNNASFKFTCIRQ